MTGMTAAVESILLLGIMIIAALIISVLIQAYRSTRRPRNRYRESTPKTSKDKGSLVNKLRENGQI